MKSQEKMNYYYGKEAEQYSFYTVPRMIFVDERYRGLSSDAKLLYGLLLSRMSLSSNQGTVIDEIVKRNEYRDLISDNIEYNFIIKSYGQSSADEILEIMLDAVCSSKEYLWISEEQIPQEVVKTRLLKLNYNHIEYVLDCMQKTTTKIRNIKNYLLTALYNSSSTMGHYYAAEVNHDLHGKG